MEKPLYTLISATFGEVAPTNAVEEAEVDLVELEAKMTASDKGLSFCGWSNQIWKKDKDLKSSQDLKYSCFCQVGIC